jgi:hypothetical protein
VPTTTQEQVPEQVEVTAERLRALLVDGGRATVSVRSHRTGDHVTLVLTARARDCAGRWVSRATRAGRVGMNDAACVEVRDPDLEYPDNYVGRWYQDGGWRPGRTADRARSWAAEHVLTWATGGYDLAPFAEVFAATTCCVCGRKLRHPESVIDLIGPECKGRQTEGRQAARTR